jgi:predicted lipoprotein with Yx(FWY)xxD motif
MTARLRPDAKVRDRQGLGRILETMARALPALLGTVLLLGCGTETGDRPAEPRGQASPAATDARATSAAEPRPRRRGIRIKAVDSQFGTIVGDARGQAVYLFDREESKESECYGDCARAWPPVLTKGRPVAGKGVRKRLLGTTRRRNGKRQVTYDGRPLYYYVDDAPGRVLCHNVREFGGLWLVLRPDGEPVP